MSYISFLFYIGTVFVIFSVIWGILLFFLNLFSAKNERSPFLNYFIKGLHLYTLASVLSIEYQLQSHGMHQIGYAFVVFILLYFYLTSKMNNAILKARLSFPHILNPKSNIDPKIEQYFLYGALLYFGATLFLPSLSNVSFTKWFHSSIEGFYNTPIIGFAFKIIGIFFTLNILLKSFNLSNFMIQRFQKNNSQQEVTEEEEYVDYEIVEDDKIE